MLLVSSNTHIRRSDEVMIGNERTFPEFTLPDVSEVDDPEHSEIDEIQRIAEEAPYRLKWPKVSVTKLHTDEISYEMFLDLISSDLYDIIHYSGHGYADSTNNFMFFWKGKNKTGPIVALDANLLAKVLEKARNLQFIYLSCCQGAATETGYKRHLNRFVGLLDPIVSAGVPIALGMRWPLSAHNSKSFSGSFYKALFLDKGIDSIEHALAKARSEAFTYSDRSVWCSPILVKQVS